MINHVILQLSKHRKTAQVCGDISRESTRELLIANSKILAAIGCFLQNAKSK